MTWTCVEPGVYFIAATLPSLRPLFHLVSKDANLSTLYKRYLGSSHKGGSTGHPAAAKEMPDDSATASSKWSGFTKLNDTDANSGEEDISRSVTGGKENV